MPPSSPRFQVLSLVSSIASKVISRRSVAVTTATVALLVPAAADADRTVLVSNNGAIGSDGSLAAFNGDEGVLTALAGSPIGLGDDVNGVAISPDAQHAYVANTGDDTITRFAIGADGTPTKLGDTPVGGNQPTGLGFTPDGKFLLATNRDSTDTAPSVSVFSVNDGNGALTPVPSSPVSVGVFDPRAVVVSPDGRFVFVTGRRGPVGPPASNADSAFAALSISSDGSLQAVTGSPLFLPGQVNSFGASITPDGKHLYAAQANGDKIHGFDIDQTTGALSAITGSPFQAAGDTPVELSVTPDGGMLWVAEAFGKSIEGFLIDGTTGSLTQAVDPVTVAGQTHGIAATPDGAFLYDSIIADPGLVEGFAIDGLALNRLTGSPYPTGDAFPSYFSVAVTPTQTPDAAFAAPGSGKAGQPLAFDASATTVAGGFPTRFDWDFGDGATAPDGGSTISHAYAEDGTYTVKLDVRNDCDPDAVFTEGVAAVGSSVYCNGPVTASVTRQIVVDSVVDGKVKAKKQQKQKGGKIVVKAKAKAGEKLTAKIKGSVMLAGEKIKLKPKTKTAEPGTTKKLKLKPKKAKQGQELAEALAAGRKGKGTLRAKLTDSAGNSKKQKLKVKLKG